MKRRLFALLLAFSLTFVSLAPLASAEEEYIELTDEEADFLFDLLFGGLDNLEWRSLTYDSKTGETVYSTTKEPEDVRDSSEGIDFKNTDDDFKFGIFVFLDWVKENYPEYSQDVDQAVSILKEHESKGSIDVNQFGDSATYEQLLKSADFLERQNELRIQDEIFPGRRKQSTNFTMLAKALVSANVSTDPAGGHRRTFRVSENLAWGYDDPYNGWYFKEKEIYKSLLSEVENFRRENPSASEVEVQNFQRKLEEENRSLIGHYLIIMMDRIDLVAIAENGVPLANSYGRTQAMNGTSKTSGDVAISEEKYREIIEEYKNYKVVKEVREAKRVYGANRVQTSTQISKRLADSAEEVILSGSLAGPDALSAGPLAVKKEAPIIQVSKNELDSFVLEELTRLKTNRVTIVGGEAAVSKDVEEALLNAGISVERIYGKDRFETSLKIAKEVIKDSDNYSVFLANGITQADALAISPVAAKNGDPVLLTNGRDLTEDMEELAKNADSRVVLGGSAVVNPEITENISEIISGKDRFETSLKIAEKYFTPEKAFIASGMRFADALSASPLAVSEDSPILLGTEAGISPEIKAYIDSLPGSSVLIGGSAVINR